MIEMRDISKRFGRVVALERVSLQISGVRAGAGGGRILGLLGENGAGKSTLMQVLFGLVRPDEGRIVVDGGGGEVGWARVGEGLGIGMVHQHFKLVPTLTGLENLALFGRRGVGGEALREEARRKLAEMRWHVPLDEAVGGLPVGQQQRIEIIKAL